MLTFCWAYQKKRLATELHCGKCRAQPDGFRAVWTFLFMNVPKLIQVRKTYYMCRSAPLSNCISAQWIINSIIIIFSELHTHSHTPSVSSTHFLGITEIVSPLTPPTPRPSVQCAASEFSPFGWRLGFIWIQEEERHSGAARGDWESTGNRGFDLFVFRHHIESRVCEERAEEPWRCSLRFGCSYCASFWRHPLPRYGSPTRGARLLRPPPRFFIRRWR